MAAQVYIGLAQRSDYLRRLSIVWASALRLKIVTELYMREMSPSQFYEEFGGGSLSRVVQNFERLEKAGWLRQVRSEPPGGKRRGGCEHFYRATELAIFDHETWSMLPYSLRAAFSWMILRQMGERWLEAVECDTFDSRPEKRESFTTVLIDEEGWDCIRAAQDALFVSLFAEQADSRLRVARSGEPLMSAIVALLGFEAPMSDDEKSIGPTLATVDRDPDAPFPWRVSKLLCDDLRMEILSAANREPLSAKTFHAAYGGDIMAIRSRIKSLELTGWLRQDSQKTGGKRRGAVEKFYRAAGPALAVDDPWNVSTAMRKASGWKAFEEISESARAAMRAGTFDARSDRHASWSLLRLDRQGWEKITAAMSAFRSLVLDEQRRAGSRLAKSGERAICTTVVEAAFESPAYARQEL